jgi:ketosteroid isomerase-like protein
MVETNHDTIRQELRALAEAYARTVDRRDVEGFVALFDSNAVNSVHDADGESRVIRGSEELARIPELIQMFPKTFHFLGQSTYDIGDGEATGEVYCIAHHLTPPAADDQPTNDYVMFIRYADDYRPDPEGRWRFAHRRLVTEWTETRAIDQS